MKLKPGLRGLLCHPQVRKRIRLGLQLLHGAAKIFVQFTGWLFRITVPARACGDLLFTRKLEFGIIDLNVHEFLLQHSNDVIMIIKYTYVPITQAFVLITTILECFRPLSFNSFKQPLESTNLFEVLLNSDVIIHS